MLSTSHTEAYQDFMTLLTEFKNFLLNSTAKVEKIQIKQMFQNLQSFFNQNIICLNSQNLEPELIPRWVSVQTEIKREFKLLSTDILFLATARQNATLDQRKQSISDRTTKLIDYCQIMLKG
jgi:hypothetical protein